jgi:hypothetical protein
MSYGMMPFAVDFEEIGGWLACGDPQLAEHLVTELAPELAEQDLESREWLEDEDDVFLPAATALRQVILGERLEPKDGHVYLYAFKSLCWAYGEFLDNYRWCPIRSKWVTEEFDAVLRTAGVPAEVFGAASHLFFRGPPFPIPESPDSFPCIGYLRPSEVSTVADLLHGIDPERFRPIDGHEQFVALRGWVESCRATNRGIISFYH